MPLFRASVTSSSTITGLGLVAQNGLDVTGASNLFGSIALGNTSGDTINEYGTKQAGAPLGDLYILQYRNPFTIPDSYSIMDPAHVYDVYQTGFSVASTSFELGHGASWFGHRIWFLNQGAAGVPVIVDGVSTWTIVAHTSALFQHVGGNVWIALARGMSILPG